MPWLVRHLVLGRAVFGNNLVRHFEGYPQHVQRLAITFDFHKKTLTTHDATADSRDSDFQTDVVLPDVESYSSPGFTLNYCTLGN